VKSVRPDTSIGVRVRLVLGLARIVFTARHPLLVWKFVRRLRYLPDPAFPKTYHEKILWRKIHDRNPLFVVFSDKIAAKEWVASRAPTLPAPRTLWTGLSALDMPDALLAGDIVVKVNSGSGMNLFLSGGQPDIEYIHRKTRRWLAKRYGRRHGEWAYGLVSPRILAEECLVLGRGQLPTDIKVYLCGDRVCHVWVEHKADGLSALFDSEGSALPGRDADYPREDQVFPPSERLSQLVCEAAATARGLAPGLDYIRVDFLVSRDRLHVGEITVYSASGYGTWSNPSIAVNASRLWDLRRSHFLAHKPTGLYGIYATALQAKLDAS
jgi:hypothetical protein